MKALIIGAGIGGLATALALRKVGLEVEVYERAPRLDPLGAGLTLWPNGVRALRELDREGAVLARGQRIRLYSTLNMGGRVLSRTPNQGLSERAGAASLCVHRTDLQQALLEGLPGPTVTCGAELASLRQTAQGVTAEFKDGRTARGDLLVGADGLRSRVREVLLGPTPLRYAGYTSWRAVVSPPGFPLTDDHGLLMLGPGSELGIMSVGAGRVYFFATRPAPPGQSVADSRAELLRLFGDWAEPVPTLLAALRDQEIIHTDIYDRLPAAIWGLGRVTLLGDSIHPTTPNLGQGACQALESAVWLAYCLRTQTTLEEGLRAYEGQRRPRTAGVTRASWSAGRMLTWSHPNLVWLRDRLLAWPPMQRASLASLERLVSWTVPALRANLQ